MSKPEEPPPTPATKIITLLEQQKIQQGDNNGTYSINLKHPIVLSNGDSINLAKGFIDTSAQDSNFIRIEPEETTITIKHGMYFTDSQPLPAAGPATKPGWGRWSVAAGERPQGTTYILQNQVESSLNTFFDWTLANNPIATTVPNFNVELHVIQVGEPLFGIMHYKLIGAPDLGIPATLPAAMGQELEQRYILDGTLNLSTQNGTIDFLFYPLGYVVPVGGIGINDHTATFTRWIDGGVIKGWKAKGNPAVTSPSANPPFAHWNFLSDVDGYNYFSDRGKSHLVQLKTIKMAINQDWNAGGVGDINEFAAVTLKYTDGKGKAQTASKTFTKYPAIPYGEGAVLQIELEILNYKNKPDNPSHAYEIAYKDLDPAFQGKNWKKEQWQWYEWRQWVDPLDVNSPLLFPSVEFSVDDPPLIGFDQYQGNPLKPVDQGFVNQNSQFKVVKNGVYLGNTVQPWQMPDLQPVNNASSSGSEMLPREYTTTINITTGDYTYSDLAQLLTDKLNKINSPVTGLSNNPTVAEQPINAAGFSSSYLLQTSYELMMQFDGYNAIDAGGQPIADDGYPSYPNNWVFSSNVTPERFDPPLPEIPARTATDTGVQPYWVSEDGTRLFSFDGGGTYPTAAATHGPQVVGAENFSIVFDDTSQRFQILQAHTPIYIDGPEISSAPVIKGPGSTILRQVIGPPADNSFVGDLITIDTSSGIFLTDLQPRTLWFNKMGFNSSMFSHIGPHDSSIQNFLTQGSSFNDASLLTCKTHPLSLETGRTKTGYFSGVDSLVTKNSDFYELPATSIWEEDVVVDTPVGLVGRAIIEASDDQPFYNIEISGINNQDISGQVFENSLIQGVVGKYFSEGNFTESNGDGFVYTHKGDTPLTIQSLRVRILDTQMQPEEGLGPNSAFILEINTTK